MFSSRSTDDSVQYHAVVAITGSIRGTSTKKLYQELALESLDLEHGSENFAYFIKYIRINDLLISVI